MLDLRSRLHHYSKATAVHRFFLLVADQVNDHLIACQNLINYRLLNLLKYQQKVSVFENRKDVKS